jgi:O-antigen ligase
MFVVAAAGISRSEGVAESWHVTHNMYLQVTSECGIPAFVLFMGILLYGFRTVNSVRRNFESHPELEWVSNMALCLYMGLAVYCVVGLSSSNAYGTVLPVFAALIEALDRTSRQYLVSQPTPAIPVESGSRATTLGIGSRLRQHLLTGS